MTMTISNVEKIIKTFSEKLKISQVRSCGSFYNAILLEIFSKLKENFSITFEENNVDVAMDPNFYDKLKKKPCLVLDLNLTNFKRQCHEINDFFNKKYLFPRVYELKNNFKYVIKKGPQKTMYKEIFQLVSNNSSTAFKFLEIYTKNTIKLYGLLNIVYKPLSKNNSKN